MKIATLPANRFHDWPAVFPARLVEEWHWSGRILPGVQEGTCQAWIVLDTENGNKERQFRDLRMGPHYLNGSASPLTFEVPTAGEVVLTETRAKPEAKLPSDVPGNRSRPCGEFDDENAETAP
jgi:hypothetical protein